MERTGKRTISLIMICILALSMILAGAAINADADSSMTATASIAASDGAVMRDRASADGSEVQTLAKDAAVTVYKEVFIKKKSTAAKNRWYYAEANGMKGYIRSDLLGTLKYKSVKKQTTDPLNYRVGPAVTMKREGTFKKNKKITVVLKAEGTGSGTWYKVKYDGKYYFVDSRYVKAVKASSNKSSKVSTAEVDTSVPQNKKVKSLNGVSYASGEKDGVKYVNITYPVKVGEGCPFVLAGTVSTVSDEYSLKAVTGYILDSKGNVVQSKKKKISDGSTAFSMSAIDAKITFGTLAKGEYTYKITANAGNGEQDVCSFKFNIVKIKGPSDITDKAIEIAWPVGTKSKKYVYPSGNSTSAFKAAFDYAFPSHKKWGKVTSKGASCDVFVAVVCRSCGYDRDMPAGLGGQWKYLPKSKKWKKVNYHFKESELRSGDIITYRRTNGEGHIMLYIKVKGKGYLCEAAYKSKYGMFNTSLKKALRPAKNVKTLSVYRAVK